MPEMDGVEATGHIRALDDKNPYYKNLPIVALTANVISGMMEMFLQCGFDDFLPKPVDTVRLNTILSKWIPKSKQKSSTEGAFIETQASSQVTIEIEGIDSAKGIRLSGGTIEYYYETLAAFYDDGIEREKEIRKCLESGNLALYTTHVHAMKSASANIGADHLSEAAYALEKAGIRRDFGFIQSNNDRFLVMLDKLLIHIHNAISSQAAKPDAGTIESGLLETELIQLRAALETYDAGEINATIDRLLASSLADDAKAFVRRIAKHILMAEYEEAIALTQTLPASKS